MKKPTNNLFIIFEKNKLFCVINVSETVSVFCPKLSFKLFFTEVKINTNSNKINAKIIIFVESFIPSSTTISLTAKTATSSIGGFSK